MGAEDDQGPSDEDDEDEEEHSEEEKKLETYEGIIAGEEILKGALGIKS